MEKHLLITLLQKITREKNVNLDNIKFFLFGSFDKVANPSDIDLLILYNKDKVKINEVLSIRQRVLIQLKKNTNIPIDISLLNFDEEEELNFVKTERAVELLIH
jgi:predicted nucleotidyltransferase